MLSKMWLLALCLVWLPCVLSRPAKDATDLKVTTSQESPAKVKLVVEEVKAADERLRRSPQWGFQVIDLDNPFGFFGNDNEIPFETRDKFTPPEVPSKDIRQRMYGALIRIEVPPHAHIIIEDEPYFGTFDHRKAILGLELYRKQNNLPPHMLKSLRPFFPFYSKY